MTKQKREAQIEFYLNYCIKRSKYMKASYYLRNIFFKRVVRELTRPINEGDK